MIYTKQEQKEHRQEWVAALRSGNYKQTQGILRRDDGYCCLGVACEISGLAEWKEVSGDSETFYIYLDKNDRLPSEVSSYYGIRRYYGDYEREKSLTLANDRGDSFDDIANIIEQEPDGLLVEDN